MDTSAPMGAVPASDIRIRIADWRDRDNLRAMQAQSMRTLGAAYYEHDVIEAFIRHIGTMDDTLIDDCTYYVAVQDGRIVGSGGWSWRTPAYVTRITDGMESASVMKATVRSVFVDPAFARRGVARAIVAKIESEIAAAGFQKASLTATLSGAPFYRRLGYRGGMPVILGLEGELTFVCLGMTKALERPALIDAA